MGRPSKGTKKPVSVWLEPEKEGEGFQDKVKMFYCYNCRIPLIEYQGNVVSIIPGRSPYTPATILKCKGSVQVGAGEWEECGIYYSFVGVVYTKFPKGT